VEAAIYINTTSRTAHASLTARQAPSIEPRLQAHLKLTCYFFAEDDDPALLAGTPAFRVALKDVATPSGSVLALLSAPTATGSDNYEFEWSAIDSAALRSLVADLDSVPAMLEIEWTISSVIERVAIPVTIHNAWIRTADSAPDPAAEESDDWLTARALRFDEAQSLTDAQLTQALTNLGIRVTAGGYLEFTASTGDVFYIGLNSGTAPA
jgi:hypothetical protein